MSDELNPLFVFQSTHVDLLTDMLNGTLDPQILVRHELACRGLDAHGRFVGFVEARRLHHAKSEQPAKEIR